MAHKTISYFRECISSFDTAGFEIASWESKGLFNEKISSVIHSKGAAVKTVYDNAGIKVKFNRNLLSLRNGVLFVLAWVAWVAC